MKSQTWVFGIRLNAGEYPDISNKELKSLIAAKKVTVIDVMGAKSYKLGHVPTAISFNRNLAKALPKDKDALIKKKVARICANRNLAPDR